ncbi:OB-fold protein [Chitinophagaceae bacterium LWZ2-11]
MKKKAILAALILILLVIVGVWFFIFYKPSHFKRDVADEKGIQVTASAIVQDYMSNETAANAKYNNKAVEVSGDVVEVKKNEDGKSTVTLRSGDSFSNVYCTLKEAAPVLSTGDKITVKGICTGFLSDVVIIDAIIVK